MSTNFINPDTLRTPRGYTHVVEVTASRTVYVAGQIALDRDGELVGPDDIRAQTRQVFDNMRAALDAVSATLGDVVKLTYFLRDAAHLPDVREVRDTYFDATRLPAASAVEVSRLASPGLLIEVEAVAVLPPA